MLHQGDDLLLVMLAKHCNLAQHHVPSNCLRRDAKVIMAFFLVTSSSLWHGGHTLTKSYGLCCYTVYWCVGWGWLYVQQEWVPTTTTSHDDECRICSQARTSNLKGEVFVIDMTKITTTASVSLFFHYSNDEAFIHVSDVLTYILNLSFVSCVRGRLCIRWIWLLEEDDHNIF